MNPDKIYPSDEDIKFLNSRGFSQMSESSWFFFKLGYVFDFSATYLPQVDNVWESKSQRANCWTIQEFMEENSFMNS